MFICWNAKWLHRRRDGLGAKTGTGSRYTKELSMGFLIAIHSGLQDDWTKPGPPNGLNG